MNAKKRLLFKQLSKISKLKKIYLKKTNYYRKCDSVTEAIIIGSGTISTTSIVLSMSLVLAPLLVVGAVTSGVATLGTALKRALSIRQKYELHKQTYLSYSELERELKLSITKTMGDQEYDMYLTDIHNRLSLIEDNAPVVSLSANSSGVTLSPNMK